MSQIVERTQADYIKSVEKQTTSSVQEEQLDDTTTQEVAGTSTEKVADTTAQELDDESHASTYLHEAHRLAYVRVLKKYAMKHVSWILTIFLLLSWTGIHWKVKN